MTPRSIGLIFMISGGRMQRWLLGLFLLFPGLAWAQSSGWDLQTLLQGMAEVKSASASFTQTQTSPLLSTPLASHGVLSYQAPAYLCKVTLAPTHETFVLDHGRVTISGGPHDQTQVFNVADAPQINGLVGGIQAVLAGDLSTLRQWYTVRLEGPRNAWQLRLQPRSAQVRKVVETMTMYGSGRHMTGMKTVMANGSVTDMQMSETITLAK